jgi:co-chaperonin GroES (HSP10)
MQIHPLGKKILLAELKTEKTSSFGIVIEGNAGDSMRFSVLAVGPDVQKIKVGTNVFLDIPKAQIVSVEGKQRLLVDEEFITAILTD